MPTIRELIPTENLYGDQFEPWLDMDLSQFQAAYQQAMAGDPAGRGSAIGIGNLLGLGTDENNQFVVPDDYQKQWDDSGNWAPTNEIDQMSQQYGQGVRMPTNVTGNQSQFAGLEGTTPNNGVNAGGLGAGGSIPAGLIASLQGQSGPSTSVPPGSLAGANGPAGGIMGSGMIGGGFGGGAIPPSLQSYIDSQAGVGGMGGAANLTDQSNPWGGIAPMPGQPTSSGMGAAVPWTSPVATPSTNSNPGLGQYGPLNGGTPTPGGPATAPPNPGGYMGTGTPGSGNPYQNLPMPTGGLPQPSPQGGSMPIPSGPPPSVFPTGTNTQGSGVTQTPQPTDPEDPFAELFGLGGLATVPNIDLGTMPTMSGGWAPGFEGAYNQNTQNMVNQVGQIYGGMQLPTAQGAQIDLNQLSQLNPQQVAQSQPLQQLLSGKGYSDSVMARLNAGSTDAINRQAGANRGSARLALEGAGLGNSPVQAAMEGQINRQRGDAATRALNENAIQNANVGMENFRQGAGMDFTREQNNMAQANAMALAKASQMLTAMSQNAGNQQQANMANFGAGVNQQMTSAGQQAGLVGQQGSAFGNASMQQQMNANQQNAGNAFNWALNQANLNQNTNNTNANLQNSQWQTGVNGLLGLGSGNGGANYSAQGNALASQQQPTNLLGSTLSNIGQGMMQ